MTSARQLAELANAVYTPNPQVRGWETVRTFGSHQGGFFAGIFLHPGTAAERKTSRTHVAAFVIRGTDLSAGKMDWSDLWSDAQLLAGTAPSQFSMALNFFVQAKQLIGSDIPIYLAGHSLGGALAVLLGTRTGCPVVTFNAPGVTRSFLSTALEAVTHGASPLSYLKLDAQRTLHLRARWDLVSKGTGPQLGSVRTIDVKAPKKPESPCPPTTVFGVPVRMPLLAQPLAWAATMTASALKVFPYLLSQHSMEMMLEQVRAMPEFQVPLGWR